MIAGVQGKFMGTLWQVTKDWRKQIRRFYKKPCGRPSQDNLDSRTEGKDITGSFYLVWPHVTSLLASPTLPPCISEVSVSVRVQELELVSRRAYSHLTGSLSGLVRSDALTLMHSWHFLLLIGSDQERTFGSTISGLIHKHIGPERLLLWDSKQRGGRPDLMKIIKESYYSFGAEGERDLYLGLILLTQSAVIFITSNYVGNFEMLHGCKEAGIPAFGTLWDFVREFLSVIPEWTDVDISDRTRLSTH